MKSDETKIYVYADFSNFHEKLVGTLYCNHIKGKDLFSFEYDKGWIENGGISIDPNLELFNGRQYLDEYKPIYGIFSDSSPDRWGRKLMNLKEEGLANKETRKLKKLTELDYLIGVNDESRMGGLRFKVDPSGDFQNDDKTLETPPITLLRDLEYASFQIERGNDIDNEKWLKKLLAPGSSLGGARPKSNVIETDNSLWIAKFPSTKDETDVGAWEMVVHDLAIKCGINVPEAQIKKFGTNGSTFLSKRFDRKDNQRIHYASAMTVLNKKDGADSLDGSSYLEIASFIRANCIDVNKNLEELYKRIIFNIAVSNNDDHLRNHGFLYSNKGWQLSPMFDVNPNIYGSNLALNISENDSSMNFDLAIESSGYYGVEHSKADRIVSEIKLVINNNWSELANKYKIKKSEIKRMKPIFDRCK